MILNISGRCDIVAFYTEWFLNRLKEGYIDVRNPFNPKLVSRINLEDVDLFYFCTKNPKPILDHLKEIDKKVYFHVTLTPYKKDIEPGVPEKRDIIESIKKLSTIIEKENLVVRYDPILISEEYSVEYHKKAFEKVSKLLEGYVNKILIHFIDDYQNVRKNYKILQYKKPTEEDYKEIGTSFSESGKKHNIEVFTCNEEKNLIEYGLTKNECLSRELAFKLTGKIYKKTWKSRKDLVCNCVEMVDIGYYNSCEHFCKYCYANYDEKKVIENRKKHNPNSSLLIGELEKDDIIKIRRK